MDVGVHREEEARRGEVSPLPEAEVDVAAPHHPAQEEVGSLARTSLSGGGKEEAESPWQVARRNARSLPEHREEAVEGGNIVGPALVPGREEVAEGALGAERLADGPQERPEGSGIDPPVDESVEIRLVAPSLPKGRGGMRPEGCEETFEGGVDRGDAPERERRGEKRSDLPVVRPLVTVWKEKGIGVEALPAPGLLEGAEARRERGDVRGPGAPSHRAGSISGEGLFRTRPGALLVSCTAVTKKDPDERAAGPADRPKTNKAILVGVYGKTLSRAEAEDHLDELERLVDTAGGVIVARALQERSSPDSATYVGKGKLKELVEAAEALEAGMVVFDDELTPSQTRNLEKELPAQVLDRPNVILSIFASRARSREAMTQVELARLQYLLPRLTGAQTGMAQQRGGGAFRAGGGEKKLELDKRKIRRRIATLKEDLEKIETSRSVRRRHLRNVATVSLVGYTNAGKTTLFNRLTSSKEFAEDRLFATLDARHARLHGVGGRAVVLSDTVGFLRKLPHTLVASFRSTLKEVEEADLLVHVVDASSPHAEDQRRVAEEVLADLGVPADRVLVAYNKTDRPGAVAPAGEIAISAVTGDGLPDLRQSIVARLLSLGVTVPVLGAPPPA